MALTETLPLSPICNPSAPPPFLCFSNLKISSHRRSYPAAATSFRRSYRAPPSANPPFLFLQQTDMAKPRANWKSDSLDTTFLETCLHEVTVNGREGHSLKGPSWIAVAEKLKNEHDFIVTRAQMKNRYDYLKRKYQAWARLRNKTGNIYNPVTNTFSMSAEEWAAEEKKDPYVAKVRNAPLVCPELCIQLFATVTATGVQSWGPSSTLPHPAEEFSTHDLDDVQFTQMETEVPNASDESCGRSKQKEGQGNSKRVRRSTLDEDLREVGKEIVNVAKMLMESERLNRERESERLEREREKEKENDVEACMEKLEKMGWGVGDPRYDTALLLFGESVDLRRVWLHLKPPSCESWVRNAGRKFGLFG